MKLYSHHGFNEFIICAGYKQEKIKQWFAKYFLRTSDITFDFVSGNDVIVHLSVRFGTSKHKRKKGHIIAQKKGMKVQQRKTRNFL